MSANMQAPELRAPRVNLVTSSEIVSAPNEDNSDGHPHWMGGIHVYPLSAKDANGVFPVCPTVEELSEQYKIKEQVFDPFVVYTTDVATSWEGKDLPLIERARQKLKVIESYWVEREFWENTQALPNNPSLVGSPATTLTTADDPLGAFVELDSAVADDVHDGRGMIHMTTKMFGLLQQYRVFRREGNVWLSPLDNIVVPGRGYTGNGPNPDGGANENAVMGTIEWMFGHPGVVQIARSEVMIFPEEEQVFKSMERTTNDVWVSAQRTYGFVVSNGVGDDAGDPVTGFYAVSADTGLVPGASGSSALTVSQPLIVDETGYPTATAYLGHTLLNDSGADATVIIYEGNDNTGAILDVITLVDGESTRAWYEPGIAVSGIYVDVTVGSINANSTIRFKV